MSHIDIYRDENAQVAERYILVKDRIRGIAAECKDFSASKENSKREGFEEYFFREAEFAALCTDVYEKIEEGFLDSAGEDEQKNVHDSLFADIRKEAYEASFCNPDYACRVLGDETGGILSMLAAELRAMIPYAYEKRKYNLTILMELLVEIYNMYEEGEAGFENIKEVIYYFFYDYSEIFVEHQIGNMIDPGYDFFTDIIQNADLSNTKYLYRFGSYIGENEIEISRYLSSLPEEKILLMAQTFVGGYIKGFEVTNKPLEKKNPLCFIAFGML